MTDDLGQGNGGQPGGQDPYLELQSCEDMLRPYFNSQLRLIGEIPLPEHLLRQTADLVAALYRAVGLRNTTRLLERDLPSTYLCLLAGFSAVNTEGNFWQAFADYIGLEKNSILSNYAWHRLFTSLADRFGLKCFTFDDSGTPYVSTIRYHGGLSSHYLPEYFEKVIEPAISRDGLKEVTYSERYKYFTTNTTYFTGVLANYMEYGGELGLDFFTKCCNLVEHARKHHGEVLTASQADLPGYVVEAFETWREHRADAAQHWSRPYILAAQYEEAAGALVVLPAQEITSSMQHPEIYWEVSWPGQDQSVTIERTWFRQHYKYQIESTQQFIPAPVESVSLILGLRDEQGETAIIRKWSLPLLPGEGEIQLVAFGEDGRRLSAGISLPPEKLYLLFPAACQLQISGTRSEWDTCAPLTADWKDWVMQAWDLSQAVAVTLRQPGGDQTIPVAHDIAQPSLSGGHAFSYQEHYQPTLYTNQLPELCIPVPAGIPPQFIPMVEKLTTNNPNPDALSRFLNLPGTRTQLLLDKLDRYLVRVRSIGDSIPNIDIKFRPGQQLAAMIFEEDKTLLSLRAILGESAAGRFEISVENAREKKTVLEFRYWPQLLLKGHDLDLKNLQGDSKDQVFFLRLGNEDVVLPASSEDSLTVEKDESEWLIGAPPNANRVDLRLERHGENGAIGGISMMVPLPRLRWGLSTANFQGTVAFQAELVKRSIDLLRQAGTSALHVEMYGLGGIRERLKLRLVDISSTEQELQQSAWQKTEISPDRLRAGLSAFEETLKSVASQARFDLVYAPPNAEVVYIPLLELSRDLEISDVQVELTAANRWRITWQEEHPLKNRKLHIRPAFQPWRESKTEKIPDTARGEHILPADCVPSRYELTFFVSYGSTPPDAATPFVVDLVDLRTRLAELDTQASGPEDHLKQKIEASLIYQALGESEHAKIALTEVAIDLKNLEPKDALDACKWLNLIKEVPSSTKSVYFNTLFFSPMIQKLLDGYDQHHPFMAEYLSYSDQLKDLMLPQSSARILLPVILLPRMVEQCVRKLLTVNDDQIYPILVKRIRENLNTLSEVILLVGERRADLVHYLLTVAPDPITDQMLAVLLESDGEESQAEFRKQLADHPGLDERVRQYLHKPEYRQECLKYQYQQRGWPVIFDLDLEDEEKKQDAADVLEDNPQAAWDALQEQPAELNAPWLRFMARYFAKELGLIRPGMRLGDPFFEPALIIALQGEDGSEVEYMELINMEGKAFVWVGEGEDMYQLEIDFTAHEMRMLEQVPLYQCFNTKKYSPNRGGLLRQRHAAPRVTEVKQPITIRLGEIKIL